VKQRVSITRILAKALLSNEAVHAEGFGTFTPETKQAVMTEDDDGRAWLPPRTTVRFDEDEDTPTSPTRRGFQADA
jgi:hypothetical protein